MNENRNDPRPAGAEQWEVPPPPGAGFGGAGADAPYDLQAAQQAAREVVSAITETTYDPDADPLLERAVGALESLSHNVARIEVHLSRMEEIERVRNRRGR